jgi:N-acetylglucosaminyldiphosphoundecaprenol N-acetyl-beta-D-mannosaminyltransferase
MATFFIKRKDLAFLAFHIFVGRRPGCFLHYLSILKMKINNRINIFNLPIDAITMNETLSQIENAIDNKRPIHHVVLNAYKIVSAQNDSKLKESIINCDIINADGQAVVWASRFLNKPLPERVAGIDLMEQLVLLASRKNYKVFFLGAEEKIIRKVIENYISKYGPEIVAGYRNGYYSKEEEKDIALQISKSNPDILFVAISSPKKEIFLNTYKNVINVPFIMGVGGSFDVVSGAVKRAPVWMQKFGLEWLYRFYQEPRRMWKRYLIGNTQFIFLILKEKFRSLI